MAVNTPLSTEKKLTREKTTAFQFISNAWLGLFKQIQRKPYKIIANKFFVMLTFYWGEGGGSILNDYTTGLSHFCVVLEHS